MAFWPFLSSVSSKSIGIIDEKLSVFADVNRGKRRLRGPCGLV